ncbi:hypothetical protein D3C77_348220 [compost metagenome]
MNSHPHSAEFYLNVPIFEAYKLLFMNDFSLQELEKALAAGAMTPESTAIDHDIYQAFHHGLKNDRLVLRGRWDDLAGWLLIHLEAYVDAEEPETPFREAEWAALTPEQRQQVSENARQLAPLLQETLHRAYGAWRLRTDDKGSKREHSHARPDS